jgi:hypothetical protein
MPVDIIRFCDPIQSLETLHDRDPRRATCHTSEYRSYDPRIGQADSAGREPLRIDVRAVGAGGGIGTRFSSDQEIDEFVDKVINSHGDSCSSCDASD